MADDPMLASRLGSRFHRHLISVPVFVSDTSVLIDLERGSFLEPVFRPPFDFAVPDLLYERELREHGGPELIDMGSALRNWTTRRSPWLSGTAARGAPSPFLTASCSPCPGPGHGHCSAQTARNAPWPWRRRSSAMVSSGSSIVCTNKCFGSGRREPIAGRPSRAIGHAGTFPILPKSRRPCG